MKLSVFRSSCSAVKSRFLLMDIDSEEMIIDEYLSCSCGETSANGEIGTL